MLRTVFLALVFSSLASPSQAQPLRLSLLVGPGYTRWTEPYAQDEVSLLETLSGAAEGAIAGPLALRGELGLAARSAYLGNTGIFSLPTTLDINRAHFAGVARLSGPRGFFADIGMVWWTAYMCDVNTTGGPGFFGGQTQACEEWQPDAQFVTDDPEWIGPSGGGSSLLIGAGARSTRVGFVIRYEPDGTTLARKGGRDLSARTATIQLEWVFRGYQP